MTDKEIIKALGCCTDYHFGGCDNCSYKATSKIVCHSGVMRDALDLINRKQAEIERLEKNLDEKNEEIDKVYDELADSVEITAVIKSEAIKEFAERLKKKVGSIPQYHFNLLQVEDDINTLVKEMTEAQNNV